MRDRGGRGEIRHEKRLLFNVDRDEGSLDRGTLLSPYSLLVGVRPLKLLVVEGP